MVLKGKDEEEEKKEELGAGGGMIAMRIRCIFEILCFGDWLKHQKKKVKCNNNLIMS